MALQAMLPMEGLGYLRCESGLHSLLAEEPSLLPLRAQHMCGDAQAVGGGLMTSAAGHQILASPCFSPIARGARNCSAWPTSMSWQVRRTLMSGTRQQTDLLACEASLRQHVWTRYLPTLHQGRARSDHDWVPPVNCAILSMPVAFK
jgi:hypothetical protein